VTEDPKVWLLLGHKAGEIAQQRALAAALGWPVTEKSIARRGKLHRAPNLLLGSGLLGAGPGVNLARSDPLTPPWPDVAISFGRRIVPAALWLRRQSGGKTRLVHVGRPQGVPIRWFDLVITMPQYQLPPGPNVLEVRLPFNRHDPERLRQAAARLAPRLAHLPRPWTLLVVGGKARHVTLDTSVAAEIGAKASAHATARGGSLLVSTSPRTPAGIAATLRATIDAPSDFYEFRRNDPDNPFAGYLGLADDIIVTSDTASMLTEAWRTGKPVQVAPLPSRPDRLRTRIARSAQRALPMSVARWMVGAGLLSSIFDLPGWIEGLVAQGRVGRLGGPPPTLLYRPEADDDLERSVARIKQLAGASGT